MPHDQMNLHVATVDLTTADTEYQVQLPRGALVDTVKARQLAVVRFATKPGRVAGPAEPYVQLDAGDSYSPFYPIPIDTTVLYFASPTAGTDVQVLYWSE